ncbi:MAG: sulfatase-like hydrolase/transferase [Bryobacterales bacterium]|nr:sulfatase-like hydrolase/transferase [Bryobacterales bacterium]
MRRRAFLGLAGGALAAAGAEAPRPNIVLAMADDQGWGDTSYNGHPYLRTPVLDEMARTGIRFDRFYSGAPVCSPTRGSCLTGRHPYRYGVFFANADSGTDAPSKYALPEREYTIAELLKPYGYTAGHFGKWHLGDFAGPMKSSPVDNGFDEFFSTTRKVPTVDPDGYWTKDGRIAGVIAGDDSRILMDRALAFIEGAVQTKKPFCAVIWFHAPHEPVAATEEHRRPYRAHGEKEQHFYGAIAAVDEQMGRLRETLRRLGVRDNTMLWYASDNGPEGDALTAASPGRPGPFRGRKRSLFEGGVRVPGLLEWPARFAKPQVISTPASTSDYVPTVLAALGLKPPSTDGMDGIDLMPILTKKRLKRNLPIAFETMGNTRGSPKLAWIEERWKLLTDLDGGEEMLFDLAADENETVNLAAKHPEQCERMRGLLKAWRASCSRSRSGLVR